MTITPNINGTSRSELFEQRLAIVEACDALISTLQQAMPNGRDYPGSPDSCQRDRSVYYERIGHIKTLRNAVTLEAITIKGD